MPYAYPCLFDMNTNPQQKLYRKMDKASYVRLDEEVCREHLPCECRAVLGRVSQRLHSHRVYISCFVSPLANQKYSAKASTEKFARLSSFVCQAKTPSMLKANFPKK